MVDTSKGCSSVLEPRIALDFDVEVLCEWNVAEWFVSKHCDDIWFSRVRWDVAVWNLSFLEIPIFYYTKNCRKDLVYDFWSIVLIISSGLCLVLTCRILGCKGYLPNETNASNRCV